MSTSEIDEQAAPRAPTARELLTEWANGQDGWVRRLVFEVLASGQAASEEALAQIYDVFLVEKGLADGELEPVEPLAHDESPDDATGGFVFKTLEKVRGVNALTEGQAIEFNPGLTILFGENGTGKTGYARVLKTVAGVRTAEAILPNVNEPGSPTPQEASIVYSLGGDDLLLEWKGDLGVPPFTQASVFDSPAVRLHVDDDLAYVYTPRDLALFHVASEGINAIQERADQDAADHLPVGNPYLQFFDRGTAVYPHIETLGPATDLQASRVLSPRSHRSRRTKPTLSRRLSPRWSPILSPHSSRPHGVGRNSTAISQPLPTRPKHLISRPIRRR